LIVDNHWAEISEYLGIM